MRLGHNSKTDLIKGVPLFSAASKQELAEIASIADEIDLPEGKVLIKEGDTGREFFVLIDGTAEVERGGKKVASIGPGDFFGEISLISKTPRNATITTTSPVRARLVGLDLRVVGDVELAAQHPLLHAARASSARRAPAARRGRRSGSAASGRAAGGTPGL